MISVIIDLRRIPVITELHPPYYYSFDYDNVHFLSLATDEFDYQEDSEQEYRFIVEDMKTASSNPNIKWIVSFLSWPDIY